MITIPMLTEKDMAIFKGKKVVLYSRRRNGIALYKCFQYCDVEVLCFCKEEKLSWQQYAKDKLRGLTDITPEQLPNYINQHANIIIQSNEFDAAQIQHVSDVAKQLGVECSPFTSGEITSAFFPRIHFDAWKNPLRFLWQKKRAEQSFVAIRDGHWNDIRHKKTKELVVICSPQKTADHSIMCTFDALNLCADQQCTNNKIEYINAWHSPRALKCVIRQKNVERIKVMVGIREPISQNLSVLYQWFSSAVYVSTLPFAYLETDVRANKTTMMQKYQSLLCCGIINVQLLWNDYSEIYVNTVNNLRSDKKETGFIQRFIRSFRKEIVDIMVHPFDQEKGYTIIQEGNTEVFVYQLEKLDCLVPELSEWVGVPFDKLEKGNVAEDKWISKSYKQAQKEIEITQEYFDKCFNEPYVKHCYSEEDIEKFKARWRPHIKKDN